MKSTKRSNSKKTDLNLKDPGVKSCNLSRSITQWYLLGAFFWFPWHFLDGLRENHNEMFLADVS